MEGGARAASIQVIVQNLINFFKEEQSLLGVDAHHLQQTLGMIEGYLNDAEKKSITQHAVKFWLRELEAVAFNADNVFDEISYHLLRHKLKKMKTPKNKVLSFFSSFDHIAAPPNMAHTIKQINSDFESLNNIGTELGLQTIVKIKKAPAFEIDSFTLDPIFVGKDDVVSEIVELFSENSEEHMLSILAIVGVGGVGKTTLAWKVFTHNKIKARFKSLIWVHVSQCCDPIILFKKILSFFTSHGTDGVESAEVILKMLQEALRAKTYLLVFDDVWNQYILKGVIDSMSRVTSTKGNGIIITTRNEEVALKLRPLYMHSVNRLSDQECWSIVKAKAFEHGDVPSKFEVMGREIARRCMGLPLAANVVGGVLFCKSEEEWRFIDENWVVGSEGVENISKVLELSFDHLSSPSLKKCFLYCSMFPRGSEMDKQELIELWMAEGFLQHDQRNDMESEGNEFLDVLLHNSLLHVARRDDYGNVRSCVMQNLVHDFAHSLLGSSDYADFMGQVRYMIYNFIDEPSPIPKHVAKNLRTLILEGPISGIIFSDFECLHVLTLKSVGDKELPNSVRKLIHLRSLNISNTPIAKLPDWIGELYHLQILRAEGRCLRKLPSTLKYLINLRHLHIHTHVELPAEIGRLTCLRTLTHFTVGDNKGCHIEELGSLNNLKGELRIFNLEKVRDKEEALKANIFQKPSLFDLRFVWGESREGERNDESVLEGLQPHANANLKKLEIEGFKGKRFPSWTLKMAVRDGPQGSWIPLNNLVQLTLSRCQECKKIPEMEHLPNLKHLYLKGLEKVRFINTSFHNLVSLYIEELGRLERLPEWLFYNNQNLSKLWISGCPMLAELPDGLHTLNFLEDLFIWNCRNLRRIGNLSSRGKSQGILRRLRIGLCRGLMMLPCRMIESWAPTLEYLSLVELSSLRNLPKVIDCLPKSARLRELRIIGVPKLWASRSVKRWSLDSLWKLRIDVSEEWLRESSVGIKETVDGILHGCCSSLTLLKFRGVENWEWMPASIQHLNALYWLVLENLGVQELPQWLGNLPSLEELNLLNCKRLRRLPSGNASKGLTKLRSLIIEDCLELHIDPEWHNIPHLIIQVYKSRDAMVTTLPAIELPKENDAASRAENLGSEPISISESKPGTEILTEESSDMFDQVISTADSNPSSISEYKTEQQFADEIEEEGILSEDSESEMYMSGFYSQQGERREEIQAVNEMKVVKDAERCIPEQQEIEPTSSNTERSEHREKNVPGPVSFQEKELYTVVLEDWHLVLKLDNQIIMIGDYPSPSPPNSSPVNAMLNLVEQDLHDLSAKPDYPNSLILFLQRNRRLTLIHPLFFDIMPELLFLDISDTKIRILPSSLFNLSKLKVLLLRNCISLETLPPEIGKLSCMEALDLSGTELYSLPDEIGQLELVRSMQLSFYGPDDESEYEHLPSRLVCPSFLSELKAIESLSISVHPEDQRWTETVARVVKYISKLEMLSYLRFYFPQVETFESFIATSPSWEKRSLSKFDFTVGQGMKQIASRVPDEVDALFIQEERCLRYVNGDKASPLIKTVIVRAKAFYLDHHTNVRSLSEFDISSFQALKFCVVRECPKMQMIMEEKNARGAFPCLEYLGIYFIWELRQIWKPASQAGRLKRMFKTPTPLRNFEALKYLTIKTCPKLRFIFWDSMIQCVAKLEELVVEDCEVVEKIIEAESKRVKEEDNVLPRLRKVVLRYLPELVSLGCGVRLSQDKISVHGCPNLDRSSFIAE